MKFGKSLRSEIAETLPEWKGEFISYKELKKQLKLIAHEEEEGMIDFIQLLDNELEKVNTFFIDKEEEYIIRIRELKDRVANMESSEDMTQVKLDILEFHGEMVLLLHYSVINFAGNFYPRWAWLMSILAGARKNSSRAGPGRPTSQKIGPTRPVDNMNIHIDKLTFTLIGVPGRACPGPPTGRGWVSGSHGARANFTLLSMCMLTCQCEYLHCHGSGQARLGLRLPDLWWRSAAWLSCKLSNSAMCPAQSQLGVAEWQLGIYLPQKSFNTSNLILKQFHFLHCVILETGLLKIVKKHNKKTGTVIWLPFMPKVLQQPFFTSDLICKLLKECEVMLNQLFL
ncbi:hypothetical protein HYC85_004036 [Camellia sinensis]|uniref:SPX domain-containing protein n=1 Tax=Camellia sinensis TaxID=4442 RepID=A0A7J7HX42_CAMSI|nr:hypothetical protein HYC85_004036 [Camellia sinensis]